MALRASRALRASAAARASLGGVRASAAARASLGGVRASAVTRASLGGVRTVAVLAGARSSMGADGSPDLSKERLAALSQLLAYAHSEDELRVPEFGTRRSLITRSKAQALYLLRPEDFHALPVKLKNAPNFDLRLGLRARLYPLSAVEAAALARWGSAERVEAERRALWKLGKSLPAGVVLPAPVHDDAPRPSQRGAQRLTGEKAVVTAIAVNCAIAASKVGAYALSGSGAMFSEMLHSFADVGNQALLYVGIRRAARDADSQFPYGYGPDRYVWSLISGVGIFFMGCGLSIQHGVEEMMHPQHVESVPIALAVLGLSFALETYSSSVAISEIRREAALANMRFLQYLRNGSDPMNAAVLMEDLAGLVGVTIAAGSIGLASMTGLSSFDAWGSIGVGGLLGVMATYIVQKNRAALIGKSVDDGRMLLIRTELLRDPIIASIHGLRAVEIGADAIRVSAEIGFDSREVSARAMRLVESRGVVLTGVSPHKPDVALLESYTEAVLEVLGDEIDELEQRVHAAIPEVRFLELELM